RRSISVSCQCAHLLPLHRLRRPGQSGSERSQRLGRGGAPGVDKPAIVLDIDETSLSNWEPIYHNKFGNVPSGSCDLKAQSACGQRDWELSAQASAIRPTPELFNLAQKLKGKNGEPVAVFFVTGRFEDPFERLATEWNLRKVGYDNWRTLFMRPDS